MKLCFYDNTTWPSEEEDAEDFKSERYKQKILSSVKESLLQVNHPKFDGRRIPKMCELNVGSLKNLSFFDRP